MSINAVRPYFENHLNPIEGDGAEEDASSNTGGADNVERRCADMEGEQGAIHVPDEEVRQTRTVKSPPMPTQEEIDAHRVSHLPYRCWCPECV